MYKETITYRDYNNNERTEDFYFNFSKAELMEMELSTSGGLSQMVQNIIAAQDVPSLVKTFKDLVTKAYGKKSPDGKRFIKSEEQTNEFIQTEAYSQLYMKLVLDAEYAAKFFNSIIPTPDDVPEVVA